MNNKELNFAYKVRRALDENLEYLPASTLNKLENVRKKALLTQKKSSPLQQLFIGRAVAGHFQNLFRDPFAWITRVSFILPAVIVAAGLIGIYQFEQQERISEIAEIDALVLADELPLSAYVDKGFSTYLTELEE